MASYLNAMVIIRERMAAASGLDQFSKSTRDIEDSFILSEAKIQRARLEGLHLWQIPVVSDANDRDLMILNQTRRAWSGHDKRTLVFFISAANAPTPPRSPADIPSTSSMMRHDLSVIAMPAAFVACGH